MTLGTIFIKSRIVMAQKHQLSLGEAQETLLIPLYGRAVETRKQRALLRDPKAVEMVEAIDYDFARFDGIPSLLGTVLRTCLIDWWVREFLATHPAGTVVEVGCGLNTGSSGSTTGSCPGSTSTYRTRWSCAGDSSPRPTAGGCWPARCSTRAGVEAVKASPGPYFFAVEAVHAYLPELEVKQALGLVAEHFPGARVALDTSGSWIVANQDRHDAMSKVAARMAWACDDPRELEGWGLGLRLLHSRDLSQLPLPLRRRLPLASRPMLPVVKVLLRQRFARYKVSLLELAEA